MLVFIHAWVMSLAAECLDRTASDIVLGVGSAAIMT